MPSPALCTASIVNLRRRCRDARGVLLRACDYSTLRCSSSSFYLPCTYGVKGKGSRYSITERGVSELIPVLGSQPAGDVNHKPDGRLPLLSAWPVVTHATLKRAATRGTMGVNSLPKTVTR